MDDAASTTERRSIADAWPLAAGAVVLALTVAVVLHPGPLPGDLAVVRRLQRIPEPAPSIARFVRATTGTEGNLVLAALPAGWLLLRRRGRRSVIAVAIVLTALLVVQPVTKVVVDRPRPGVEQVDVRAEYESLSFPSGHSLSTTTVWGVAVGLAWCAGRRRWALVAVVPIAVTAIASGVQGVHWPSDAVAGTLIGAIAAHLVVGALGGRWSVGRSAA